MVGRWRTFWFPAEGDAWLGILRIGLALHVIAYCLSLRGDWIYLFAGHGGGLLGRELSEVSISSESCLIPRLGWLVEVGSHCNLNEVTVLWLVWTCLFGASLFLATGLFCRTSAICVWFFHLCAVKSGGLLAYGMDDFTTIGSFYLMVSPLPDRYSVDHKFRILSLKPAEMHGFFRRVLQLHLCIAYFFGGVAKVCGPGWWNGDSVWRSLTHPPFDIIAPNILVQLKYLLPVFGIAVWCLELGYPIFIWMSRTRFLWLAGIIAMHFAIGLTMGMYLFASILIVLNLAAFGPGSVFPRRLMTKTLLAGAPPYRSTLPIR